MSPFREACQQLERDQRFQAFMDWARKADVTALLWHCEQLMKGNRDPYYRLSQEMSAFAESDGWSVVISSIAQAQKEREQAMVR